MIHKILIPVVNTENGKYEYNGELSRDAYSEMEYAEFRNTDRRVNRFVDNMANGISNISRYRMNDVKDYESHPDLLYQYFETEAIFQNANKDEIEEEYLIEHFNKEDMFILILNINTNTLDMDAESELRYWLDDSRRVESDKTLDNKTKLKLLPFYFFKVKIGERNYVLKNCKMLQNYGNNKSKYFFAVLVEKIILEQ